MAMRLTVSNSTKLHLEFDLAAAKELYAGVESEGGGGAADSPYDAHLTERLRDLHGVRRGKPVPTDVFIWGKGEASRRDGTKVGGLPYWPADRPWPTDDDGIPDLFFAQFNFADSRDLFPDLPGDVLVMFAEEDTDEFYYEPMRIRFEWLSLGLTPVDDFDPAWGVIKSGPFYGVIFRTADYPTDDDGNENPCLTAEPEEEFGVDPSNLPILGATKIGGVPALIQEIGDRPGTFLCQLGSIVPPHNVPYPWINEAEPLGLGWDEGQNLFPSNTVMFGDGGEIYLYLQADGTIQGAFACY
jgi:hypothetical protein